MDSFVVKVKRNNNHDSAILKLGFDLMSRVMQNLTLTDNARLSRACYFFYKCFKGLWINNEFFNRMDLSKYSNVTVHHADRNTQAATEVQAPTQQGGPW